MKLNIFIHTNLWKLSFDELDRKMNTLKLDEKIFFANALVTAIIAMAVWVYVSENTAIVLMFSVTIWVMNMIQIGERIDLIDFVIYEKGKDWYLGKEMQNYEKSPMRQIL